MANKRKEEALQPKSAEAFFIEARRRSITSPVWFAENVLLLKRLPGEPTLIQDPQTSWALDQWTKNLLNAAGDVVRKQKGMSTRINHEGLNQITVRAMHGPGKTFGLAVLMHWFGFCFKGKIPCTAPKLGQLKSRLWPEFRKVRNRAIDGYKDLMKVQGQSIFWKGEDGWDPDHWAFMETASAPENLAGLHDRYMLICVDEASGVDEALWPVIEGAISTGKIVILVIISNPTRTTGSFADSHLKELVARDWFQIHIKLEDTLRVSRSWVKRMQNKYGKTSPVVKVRCLGEFADDDEGQLISLEWIENARAIPHVPDGSIPRKRISIDVADGGGNFTVLTYAIHYESFVILMKQMEFSFIAGRAVSAAVKEAEIWWKRYKMSASNGDDIVVDSLGVGAGVCSGLLDKSYPVIRYIGGGRSSNPALYRNRRVQSYLTIRDKLRNETMIFADEFVQADEWDDVLAQMCSIKRKIGTERVEDLYTKEEMKADSITSPDRADSIAMQMATQSPMLGRITPESVILGQPLEHASYDAAIA